MIDARYRISRPSGAVLVNTLTSEEEDSLQEGKNGIARLASGPTRLGRASDAGGSVLMASRNPDHLASAKTFKSAMDVLLSSIKYVEAAASDAEAKSQAVSKRLIHNLTSLNGHMIQDLYSVVSQDRLAGNIRRSVPLILDEMRSKKAFEFAKCFLSLAKHSAAMKTEFSVFKKLNSMSASLDRSHHYAHKVVMNAAYLFFSDFADNGCFIDVAPSEVRCFLDYESAFVAFYHLFENSAKYICPETNLGVRIFRDDTTVSILFDMQSLVIKEEEVLQLTDEGFSGEEPRRLKKAGDGVGMSLVKRVMTLHGGTVRVEAHPETRFSKDGIPYQRNVFRLTFPL